MLAVHARIREKDQTAAAFGDGLQHVVLDQIGARLRGEDHGRVAFAPCLEAFHDVGLHGGVAEKQPGFVEQEELQRLRRRAPVDMGVSAVQDVEEQRFEDLRILLHSLEIEGVEVGTGQRVLGIVEERRVLPAIHPPRQMLPHGERQAGGQSAEPPHVFIQLIDVHDGRVQVLVVAVRHAVFTGFDEHLHEREQEVQILRRRVEPERVNGELVPLDADAHV